MTTKTKLFTFLAWLQLLFSVLLASAMVWGYMSYQASFGQFIHSVAASIGAVSNVVVRTAETIETRRDLLDQTGQMLVVTRNLVKALRVAADNQAKMAPQYAAGLRSASNVSEQLGGSLESIGQVFFGLSLPTSIQMQGMRPVPVMSHPWEKQARDFINKAHDIKAISATLSGISDTLNSDDGKNVSSALVVTSEQALKVISEVEKTLEKLKTQDLPKAIADLRVTSANLSQISTQIDMVGNVGLVLLVVGLLLAGWCFLHSLSALMLANSRAFTPVAAHSL